MTQKHELVQKWYQRVTVVSKAHYLSATYFARMVYLLGVPVVVLSALAGGTAFATLGSETLTEKMQIAVGSLSLLASVLAAVQIFLNYPERAEKHRIAGARYGAIGRRLEQSLTLTEFDDELLDSVRTELDELGQESPSNSNRIWKRAGGPTADGDTWGKVS